LKTSEGLVFVSHSEKDWKIAAHFGELIRTASKYKLEPFFTSDRTGVAGPSFGKQWITEIQDKLRAAKCMVTLLTVNSISRPWVIYENGIAQGLNKKVYCVLLGIEPHLLSKSPFEISQSTLYNSDMLYTLLYNILPKPNLFDIGKWSTKKMICSCIEKFIAATNQIIPAGQCDSMTETQLLEYLFATRPLKGEQIAIDTLCNSDDLFTHYFMSHYWELYTKAIEKYPRQVLALPSEPRMEAAIEALKKAQKQVRAISIVNKDQWHQNIHSEYHRANRDKATEKSAAIKANTFKMRRLFVFESEDAKREYMKLKIVQEQRDCGIKLRYVLRTFLLDSFSQTHKEDAPLVNLLIVDELAMTLSSSHSSHGGKLVLNQSDIKRAGRTFEHAWAISQDF
jgi:hypothetical protein